MLTTGQALVVDDDPAIRVMVTKMLERRAIWADVAVDGMEALQKIDRKNYAVVLLDLMMPRLDGFGVLEYLRQKSPERMRQIIVMTGFYDLTHPQLSGIASVLRKPFDMMQLLDLVEDCIHRNEN